MRPIKFCVQDSKIRWIYKTRNEEVLGSAEEKVCLQLMSNLIIRRTSLVGSTLIHRGLLKLVIDQVVKDKNCRTQRLKYVKQGFKDIEFNKRTEVIRLSQNRK